LIPIYYINLANAPHRRRSIESQLSALGLAATRIEAVTPADIPGGEIVRYCTPGPAPWIQAVELACTKSHIEAWRRLQTGGAKLALVLEDDIVLSSRLPELLHELERETGIPDLIQVQTALTPVRLERQPLLRLGDISIVRTHGFVGGSAAYLVSSRLAARLIDNPALFVDAIDRVLFDSLGLGRQIGFAHCVPALATQAHVIAAERELETSAIAPEYRARTESAVTSSRSFNRLRALWYENVIIGGQKVWLDLTGRRKQTIPFAP